MEFPRFVFRCPGAKTCNGGTYDHVLVENAEEHAAAVKAGYSATLPEALKHPVGKAPEALKHPVGKAPAKHKVPENP